MSTFCAALLLCIAGGITTTVTRYRAPSPELLKIRAHGYELFRKRLYPEAAAVFEEGYRRSQAAGDSQTAVSFLNNAGSMQFAQYEYRAAIDTYVRARDLARSANAGASLPAIYANLCSLYLQIGDIAAAQSTAEKGLHADGASHLSYLPQFLGILGVLEGRSGNTEKALDYFRQAVRAAETQGDNPTLFEAWSHYAQELFQARRGPEAERAALNAYRIGRLADVRELRPAYLLLARIARTKGDLRTANSLVSRGLEIPGRSADRQLWHMYFRYERGLVRSAQNRNVAALADFRSALVLARDWREAIAPSDSLRSGASFWLGDLYEAFIQASASNGTSHPEDVFLAVEEERAASLVQTLGSTKAWRSQVDRKYWQDLAALRSVQTSLVANGTEYDQYRAAQLRQGLLEEELSTGASIIPSCSKTEERIFSGNTLSSIRRGIRPEEALLSLHLGQQHSFVWALTRNRLEMHRLAPGASLSAMAEQFRRAVETGAQDRDRLGEQLYSELFGHLSPRIVRKQRWLITADDSLFELPLAALVVERKRQRPVYLVEKHTTQRIPSAFMLCGRTSEPASGPFLGVGDGIYNRADSRWKGERSRFTAGMLLADAYPRPSIEVPRLAGSRQELEACGLSSGLARILLTGEAASQRQFEDALVLHPSYIHFAAHVLHPTGQPERALIHLGLSPNGKAEVLTAEDIANLRVPGTTIIMSGCSSAASPAVRGAGVLGLTRAWLVAGARAVIGSRWPIPDDTGDLFRSFYQYSRSAPRFERASIAEPFREAQLQMLHSHTWRSDPRYWSAFYLITKD